MSIAIQFDGHQLRSLRCEHGRLLARQAETTYLVIPGDDSRLKILEKQAAHLAHCEQGLILFGPTANDVAELLQLPLQSAFEPDGNLRDGDPVSRQFVAAMVDGLLPPEPKSKRCAVIASSGSGLSQKTIDFFHQLVRLRGYEVTEISPGAALILAVAEQQGYSGIAIEAGNASIDVSVVHRTREFVQFGLGSGHCLLDQQLAREEQSYLRLQDGREILHTRPLRIWRESVDNIHAIESPRKLDLRQKYRLMLTDLFLELKQHLSPTIIRQIPSRLPLFLGGEFARIAGFTGLVQEILHASELPIEIHGIEAVHHPEFACLKGGLIAIETAFANEDAQAA